MAASVSSTASRRSARRALPLRLPLLLLLASLSLLLVGVVAVDRSKFRTCRSTAFCQRMRNDAQKSSINFAVETSGVSFDSASATLRLPLRSLTFPNQPALDAQIALLHDGVVRLTARESSPLHPRHGVRDVIQDAAARPFSGAVQFVQSDSHGEASWTTTGRGDSYESGQAPAHTHRLRINWSPFRLEFSVNGVLVMEANSNNMMHFEQYRTRNPRPQAPQAPTAPVAAEGETPEQTAAAQERYQQELANYATEQARYESESAASTWPYDEAGMWEESHGGHTDVKSKGPAAIGLDVSFVNARHAYGIPEHASAFSLKNTIAKAGASDEAAQYQEPFRLYNLDVFEYELDEPMALYGAVPYVASHTVDGEFASGVLWLNAAETFVDMSQSSGSSGGLFGGGGDAVAPRKTVHWMSETGVLDVFFVLGPRPSDLFGQYTALTGFPFLPPQFAIAYHQCRWNYKSSDDVLAVDAGFDQHDIPYDVLWLDIEHTDAKKYFTWDKASFPDPTAMQQSLAAKGRKMVNIVDPHIKRDSSYHVHQESTSLGHYVKNKNGGDYEGWCWPGSASYLDFFQSKVRSFWADLFRWDRYAGSTPSLFIWNDMNEPSVFNGPEVTMPKDNLHSLDGVDGQVEHRDVHNQYGMYVHMATAQGLTQRANTGAQRPFVLTRAFFAGSQRTAAVWTGDNAAKWSHLQAAQPMLLSLAVGQIPFSGADVGGFFGDPDAQLLTRWYQAAVYHPFLRAHAHIDTKRREPWLFGEPYTSIIRAALRTRYANLPYLYTLFYLNSVTGFPIMRPLWVEFTSDQRAHGAEDAFMLGPALLVHPVVQPDQLSTIVYLPTAASASPDVWFDLASDAKHTGGQSVTVATPLQHIPVFQRGGTIVVRRERARRSSTLMVHDPYTLVVALSSAGTASGQLFIDDTNSFAYQSGSYLLIRLTLSSDGVLSAEPTHTGGLIDSNVVERIVVLGAQDRFSQATLMDGIGQQGQRMELQPLNVQATNNGQRIIIRKPDVRIGSAFQIKLH